MTCRFLQWTIEPAALSGRAPSLPAGIATTAPALRHERLPPEVGMLLPCADTNQALLSALDAAPARFAGLAVGLFLSDPFLNVELAIRRLRAAGVAWVAAFPSACQHEVDFRRYLQEVDLDIDRELRVLAAFSDAGLATIAAVSSASDAAAAAAALPSATLALPDVSAFVDGYPGLALRLDLERVVTREGREPPALLRLGLRLAQERADPGGLDGVVLPPQPF